jgi:hypothetical protein
VLFLSLIFCKQEEKLLFFGSISGCTCLILSKYFFGRGLWRLLNNMRQVQNIVEDFEVP